MPTVSGEPGFSEMDPARRGALTGQLVRKNLREMLLTLDFYVALLLSRVGR